MHIALYKLFLILRMTLQNQLYHPYFTEKSLRRKKTVSATWSTQTWAWKLHNLQVAEPGFSAKVKLVFLSLPSTKILPGFFIHTLVCIALPLPHTKGIE